MPKAAAQILEDLLRHVEPPRGVAIVVTERNPIGAGDCNWLAAMGVTDLERNARFAQKLSDLQKSDPIVDWSNVSERDGQNRRVAKWLSDL